MATAFQTLEAELLFPLIPESGRLALDIGANTGVWSRELARHFARVDAYEPQPGITDAPDNVVVMNAAIGDHDGTTRLRLYGNTEHATIVDRPDVGYGPQRGTLETLIFKLDGLYIGRGVDFIKIDVEGAEVGVILGARQLLERDKPQLLIEVHSPGARRELIMSLTDTGYKIRVIPNPTPGADDYCWISAR